MFWDMLPVFIFIIAIVAIVMGVGSEMYRRNLNFKERKMGLMGDKTAEQAAQYAAKAEKLEQRVRVLERIATDKGADLAAQIEDLREHHENREHV